MEHWPKVLDALEESLPAVDLENWFLPLKAVVGSNPDELWLVTPNPFYRQHIEAHFQEALNKALKNVGLNPDACLLLTPQEWENRKDKAPKPAPKKVSIARGPESEKDAPKASEGLPFKPDLNPKYTLDSFVVGKSNQFAHAACQAVAEAPGQAYNPLFIYGGVGLGKTHLLQAIGNQVLQGAPESRITYSSAEKFLNEMVNALSHNRLPEFKNRYRHTDILLIDDIQFLAGKERTQEEFFHTFNALHEAGKQVVISADCAPRSLSNLEERLRSRFEWGLIADIQAPDLETKIAILVRKAELDQINLPDDVALYIASNCKSNVRELEGCLLRLAAYASLKGKDISMELAKEAFRDQFTKEDRQVTIDAIQKHVATYYKMSTRDLVSKSHKRTIVQPRNVAMYLSQKLTGASLPEIGRQFGGKHHSTVLHGIRQIDQRCQDDTDFNKVIHAMMESLQ